MRIARPFGIAALAASLSIAAGTATPTRAEQLTAVGVSILPILPVAPFYAAVQEGYFKAEGLDATPKISAQGGAVGIPGLVAGTYDVAYSNTPSVFLALAQGIDLRIIAGSSKNPAKPPELVALVGRKDDNLHVGHDLEGKTIAVAARGDVQWLFARAWVSATGGDPDKVTYREAPPPQMIDAIQHKQVDAAVTIEPFLTFSKRDPGLAIIAWPFNAVAPGTQVGIYVVTADTAKKRPEMIAKFVRGLRKGSDWIAGNLGKDPYLKLVSNYSRLDPGLISALPPVGTDTDVDVPSLKLIAKLMRKNGMLTKDIDIQSAVVAAP
jgi:NitT/TauT family transport system substrate-binding protein